MDTIGLKVRKKQNFEELDFGIGRIISALARDVQHEFLESSFPVGYRKLEVKPGRVRESVGILHWVTHLVTDESPVYYFMAPEFAQHSTVNHKAKEYVRREANFKVTTNTVESFFALLKRSNYGIHHHMSRKYLGSYCAERDFVYNGRKLSDDERTTKALKATEGKRLMLKQPKNTV